MGIAATQVRNVAMAVGVGAVIVGGGALLMNWMRGNDAKTWDLADRMTDEQIAALRSQPSKGAGLVGQPVTIAYDDVNSDGPYGGGFYGNGNDVWQVGTIKRVISVETEASAVPALRSADLTRKVLSGAIDGAALIQLEKPRIDSSGATREPGTWALVEVADIHEDSHPSDARDDWNHLVPQPGFDTFQAQYSLAPSTRVSHGEVREDDAVFHTTVETISANLHREDYRVGSQRDPRNDSNTSLGLGEPVEVAREFANLD